MMDPEIGPADNSSTRANQKGLNEGNSTRDIFYHRSVEKFGPNTTRKQKLPPSSSAKKNEYKQNGDLPREFTSANANEKQDLFKKSSDIESSYLAGPNFIRDSDIDETFQYGTIMSEGFYDPNSPETKALRRQKTALQKNHGTEPFDNDEDQPILQDYHHQQEEDKYLFPCEKELNYFFGHLLCVIWKHGFYDADVKEFTDLQRFNWAVVIGTFMGIFTAKWSELVEFSVDYVWATIPEKLLEWGVFTDVDGYLPLPHYIWITTACSGGILSWISAVYEKRTGKPVPGQNEWIDTLHRKGVLEVDSFLFIFIMATLGMASGLSLGPELPLVLTAGMVGSFLGLYFRQSLVSARVLNLAAASAAIGGFFGFPMAGAFFVMEIPHRDGMQYTEALNPSIIASIVSVIVNRVFVSSKSVKGYFSYPFLTNSLPPNIFWFAIVYGLVGGGFGVFYVKLCKYLKTKTHDLFHYHEHTHHQHGHHNGPPPQSLVLHKPESIDMESLPLDGKPIEANFVKPSLCDRMLSFFTCNITIKHEPKRAMLAGVIAGAVVGVTCMFLPHNLFWGEAQLQNLLDGGATPLPVFGQGEEPTAALTAYGYCMTPPPDVGYGLTCSALLVLTKILVIGLSLGTGIIGGHFWGPLFVGAAGANFFTDLMRNVSIWTGVDLKFTNYHCLALICIMGSTHVVTFKAHTAIMLILTLTVSDFSSIIVGYSPTEKEDSKGGDYSAIFPLLVVSVYISLMATSSTVFYNKQRNRGDIVGHEGAIQPVLSDSEESSLDISTHSGDQYDHVPVGIIHTSITSEQIDRDFHFKNQVTPALTDGSESNPALTINTHSENESSLEEFVPPSQPTPRTHHRRVRSEDFRGIPLDQIGPISTGTVSSKPSSISRSVSGGLLKGKNNPSPSPSRRRITSWELDETDMQPSLLDQARIRANSRGKEEKSVSKSVTRKLPKSGSTRSLGQRNTTRRSLSVGSYGANRDQAEQFFGSTGNSQQGK